MVHEVALALGKFAFEVKREMPYEELVAWMQYFERKPLGWREDSRAYKLMCAFGTDAKPGQVFESLAIMSEQEDMDNGKTSMKNFKNSALYQGIVSAKGGDEVNYEDSSKGSFRDSD